MVFFYILAALVALCAIIFFMIMPAKTTQQQRLPMQGLNCAHRGLHSKDKTVPENSLAAFVAAADAGYGMELDIQLSKDGQVVVFHDDTLDRVCGVEGRVDAFTFDELQNFSLHKTQEKIPLFADVLEVVSGKTPMIVELKMHPTRNKELCEKAWQLLENYKGAYCVESFDPRIVRWFRLNAPQVLRGQLASNNLGGGMAGFFVSRLLTNFFARPHFIAYSTGATPITVRIAKKLAMNFAWTVRPKNDIKAIEKTNDSVIFEFYTPKAKFK